MERIPIRHLTQAEKEPEFSKEFRIRDLADLLAGKDMVQDLHRHDFFFVLALEKAKGRHDIDFIPYKVMNRSVFIVRPGQVHQLTLKAGSAGYLMGFSRGFYQRSDRGTHQVLRKASNTNVCQVNASAFKKLHAVLSNIFQEYRERRDGYQEVIRANLDIFFIEFVRQRETAKSPSGKRALYEQERLEQFMELLETHIVAHKQVADYAGMMNISAYQLNAITKASLGKTSSAVIDEYIILESKRQLLATSHQVNQIAYVLGYEDPSYFIRFFKRHTGYSPDAFRINFR